MLKLRRINKKEELKSQQWEGQKIHSEGLSSPVECGANHSKQPLWIAWYVCLEVNICPRWSLSGDRPHQAELEICVILECMWGCMRCFQYWKQDVVSLTKANQPMAAEKLNCWEEKMVLSSLFAFCSASQLYGLAERLGLWTIMLCSLLLWYRPQKASDH